MAELTRRDRTILLLRSRHDWQQGPEAQKLKAIAKPGVGGWERCERCAATGRVIGIGTLAKPCRGKHGVWPYQHRCRPCLSCEDGWIRTGGDAGSDRMLDPGKHEIATVQQQKVEQREAREREEMALESQLAPPPSEQDLLAAANEHPYGWEIEREKHFKAGSYRELDQALEWLSAQNAAARALVGWVYESGADTLGCLDDSILRAADLAIVLVAARLPDPIRVPHWLIPAPRQGKWTKQAA